MIPAPRRRSAPRRPGIPIALAALAAVLLFTLEGQPAAMRLRQAWHAARKNAVMMGRTSPPLGERSTIPFDAIACPVAVTGPPVLGAGPSNVLPPPTTVTARGRALLTRLAGYLGMDSLRAALSTSEGTAAPSIEPQEAPSGPSAADTALALSLAGGVLTVAVDEGTAVVIIDGVPRGRTPYAICLGQGRHTVSARSISDSYQPTHITVSIADDETTSAVFHRAAPTRSR